AVLRLFREVRRAPFLLAAYEFFTDVCYARVQRHRTIRLPFEERSACYVLLEVENADPDALEAWLGSLLERGFVTDGSRAQGIQQARELWELRESIGESLAATGFPHKNDIALPVANLEAFCAEMDQVFSTRYPGWEVCVFGHIGDGNLHVNVLKPDGMSKEEFLRHTHAADQTLFQLVRRHSGSISAEHGIGLLKKDALHYSRSPAELDLFRALKRALDPNGILNPAKIFDP
ncbi:MAG TPA: FAD-linked oxidase C-terminal domain-containing protein, partial [Myxococcaceae bacterium]|nr:FAD-linked oxidase C-terminal domain-containing protein [Myxococcaceae bacterium]